MIFFSLRSYDLAIFTRVFLIIIYFIYFYRSFTKHIEYNDLLSYFFYLFWKIETSTSSFAAIYTLIANRENIHEHIPWITRDRFTAESEPFQFSQSEEKNRWLRSGADGITGPTQTWGKIRPIVFPESSGEWLPRDDLHFASSLTRRDIETFSNFSVPPTNILAHRMKRAFPSSFFSLNRLETNFRAWTYAFTSFDCSRWKNRLTESFKGVNDGWCRFVWSFSSSRNRESIDVSFRDWFLLRW